MAQSRVDLRDPTIAPGYAGTHPCARATSASPLLALISGEAEPLCPSPRRNHQMNANMAKPPLIRLAVTAGAAVALLIASACSGAEDTDSSARTTAQSGSEEYSILQVGETRRGTGIDTTIKSFEAGVPGPDALPNSDYSVADVEMCITSNPDNVAVLLGPANFAVADSEGHLFELGWASDSIIVPGTVKNDGPDLEQRKMRTGCLAGTVTVEVPAGTELTKVVLRSDDSTEVAEWQLA